MNDKRKTHSPEPWQADIGYDSEKESDWVLRDAIGDGVAEVISQDSYPRRKANVERIVACVNALKGKNPKAIADVVYALEAMVAHYCDLMPLSDSQRARLDEEARTALDFLET